MAGKSTDPNVSGNVPSSGLGDENKPAFIKEEGETSVEFDKEINAGEAGAAGESGESGAGEAGGGGAGTEGDGGAGEAGTGGEGEPKKPFKQFQTQQEYEDAVELDARRRAEAAKKNKKTPEKKEPVKLYDGYFDEEQNKWIGEQPRDWNEFANRILDAATPRISEELKGMTAKEKAELADINKELDEEYNGLAQEGKVPPLKSEEGQKVNKSISRLAAQYGITSITKGYELWSKIPVDQGGGLNVEPPKPDPKKVQQQNQKKAAGLVGSSKGSPSKDKPKQVPYNKLHNTDTDQLIEEQLEQTN